MNEISQNLITKSIDHFDYESIHNSGRSEIPMDQPILLSNGINHWSALNKWSFAYLSNEFGDIAEDLDRSNNEMSLEERFTLKEYIKYIQETSDSNPFYFKSQFHRNTNLKYDYDRPEIYPCWYSDIPLSQRKFDLTWIYIGAKGTYSELHLDIWNTSAWNAVVSGKKLWVFYTLDQAERLFKNQSFDWKSGKENPDDQPIYCIQNQGDLVYTPSGWWHAVYNLEAGVSVTENFINESNYHNVIDYFERQNQFKSANSIRKIAEKHLSKLNYEN